MTDAQWMSRLFSPVYFPYNGFALENRGVKPLATIFREGWAPPRPPFVRPRVARSPGSAAASRGAFQIRR
ncbi:MAG: hypothetical protein ACI81V_000605 [Lentimonas sp.]|jgi:hypothetical protein